VSSLSFPRRFAKTQRFTLGEPRNVTVSPDGARLVFARSRGADDPVNCLWVYRPELDLERIVADPLWLLRDHDADDLPAKERARRERAREGAGGVVAYSTDRDVLTAAFALSGRLFVGDLLRASSRELAVAGPVFDPQLDPTGNRIAYVQGTTTRICDLEGDDWELAGDDDPLVSWGSAEFVAAEEMGRHRGMWWSPDGTRLAICRVDVSPVDVWYIADPANPWSEPIAHRYPVAGTRNARVTLHVLGVDDDHVVQADYDFEAWPYLATVGWCGPDRLLVTVQSRDQRRLRVIEVDATTGGVTDRFADEDEHWVELVPGVPGQLIDGRLVTCADRLGSRRLMVDGVPVSLASEQVRSVVNVGDDHVTFTASPVNDPTVQHVWRWLADGRLEQLTTEPGVHTAIESGTQLVVRSSALDRPGTTTTLRNGPTLLSLAEAPNIRPSPELLRVTDDRIAVAVLLPSWHDGSPLPVLLDPYGGPHAQRVVASYQAYLTSQWFADQGFAVVVADGRGTPGRGTAWERAVYRDLAGPVLDDQVRALEAVAKRIPALDLARVGIRGWSFGGYLAALAVLRRPDVFHAAVAGAPVTDWRLYDTHYTERYLGDPTVDPAPYDATSLITMVDKLAVDVVRNPRPFRPLLLVHGLADDNVVAAHTLRLSSALLAAGYPHEVLPLSGVTHMTPQEVVAEHLLLHQLDFLRRSLGVASPSLPSPHA
jgi:dipeptidyl-peptidase-4